MKNFEDIYKKSLKKLRLREGNARGKTFIGVIRWFGLLEPKVIGEILEKPQITATGVEGQFRVLAYETKSSMWDLAEEIEKALDVESEVEIQLNP